jgi:hypothetical protein
MLATLTTSVDLVSVITASTYSLRWCGEARDLGETDIEMKAFQLTDSPFGTRADRVTWSEYRSGRITQL